MNRYKLFFNNKHNWEDNWGDKSYYENYFNETELLRKTWRECGGTWRECGGTMDRDIFIGNRDIIIQFQLIFCSEYFSVEFKEHVKV